MSNQWFRRLSNSKNVVRHVRPPSLRNTLTINLLGDLSYFAKGRTSIASQSYFEVTIDQPKPEKRNIRQSHAGDLPVFED
jgi:hypothetical protein